EKVLLETGLPAKTLELEIPSWVVLKEKGAVYPVLGELQKMGFSLVFDHYGAGGSTLNEMKGLPLPIRNIKLDRDLVRNMIQNPMDASLAGMITAAAHNLGIRVTATGVENEEELHFLMKNGCDDVQGNLFSKPLTNEEFTRFLVNPITLGNKK